MSFGRLDNSGTSWCTSAVGFEAKLHHCRKCPFVNVPVASLECRRQAGNHPVSDNGCETAESLLVHEMMFDVIINADYGRGPLQDRYRKLHGYSQQFALLARRSKLSHAQRKEGKKYLG